ncbi:MAG TPA: MFS transporter [Steroidobacteraceae bacterium]
MGTGGLQPGANHDEEQGLPSRRHAWFVFVVLVLLMVIDYVDRQVVVSMFPHLRAQWNLSDRQLGSLVSIVSVVVALATVPLSLLADRWSRVRSIVVMAVVWSLASIACAFARDYDHLLVARGFVGLGEAAYGAAGAALLASIFPARLRSTVLGAFLSAGLVGSVVGVMLGGVIAERWGWRAGFGLVGVPGLVLALLVWLVVRDEGAMAAPKASGVATPVPLRQVVAQLLRPRTVSYTCVGAGLQLLVVSSIWAWAPSYFNRHYGLAPDVAGIRTGLVVLLGAVGSVGWSVLADRLARRDARARLYVPAAVAVATAVCMCSAFGLAAPGPVQFALILAGGTVMTGTIGAVAAVVVDVVNPTLRATAAAVLSLTQNLIGLAAGPLLVGLLSDAYGLTFALSVVPLCCLLAAGMFVTAARSYAADLDRASTAAVETSRPYVQNRLREELS